MEKMHLATSGGSGAKRVQGLLAFCRRHLFSPGRSAEIGEGI